MVTKTMKKAFLITALLSIPYVAVKAADADSPYASGIGMPQLDPAQQALVQAFIETKAQLEQNQKELDQTKQELVAAQAKIKQLKGIPT